MNIFKISWRNFTHRPLQIVLNSLLLATGIGIMLLLQLVSFQIQQQLSKNQGGIDAVIAAKGSKLQIILSSLYQADAPTGNIKQQTVDSILQQPLIRRGIAQAIPLSMGDSYQGFRIVGTTHHYLNLFGAVPFEEKKLWRSDFEATIGYTVAQTLGLSIGDTFESTHGLTKGENLHENEHRFTIVSVLKPTGAVIDKLILTTTNTFLLLHEDNNISKDKEITAILLKFRNPMAKLMLPGILKETPFEVAFPADEILRIYELLGLGTDLFRVIAFALMLMATISIFVTLYSNLQQRKFESALMQVVGATQWQIFMVMFLETSLILVVGGALGVGIAHIGVAVLAHQLGEAYQHTLTGNIWVRGETITLLAAFALNLLAALLPALQVARHHVSKNLS